jgi:hypothetical protein
MKRFFLTFLAILLALLIGFSYGYLVHRNQLFPYRYIKKAFLINLYRKSMQWSVGIYKGNDPFHLSAPKDLENPVLTAKDVTDADAAFIADPFMVEDQGKYYLFFEVLNLDTNTGDIGYAESDDGRVWNYGKIVLDEEFHISYPCVYQWDGQYYMIPESGEDRSVRLYRAVSFPEQWEYLGNLLEGETYYDPTVFPYNGRWWMFTSTVGNGDLNLFYSDRPTSGWKPHPMNPLIEGNPEMARPAGRVFEYENRLFRLAQDDHPSYGIQVYAVEITELTPDSYQEKGEDLIKLVTMSGKGWNAVGMHHADLHHTGGLWMASVDGLKRRE